jgi:hypothetical protein
MRFVKALLVTLCILGAAPAFAQDAGSPDMGASASVAPDPGVDAGAFIKSAFDAAQRGDYRMFAALALIGVVYVARKYGAKVPGKIGAFAASDRGGAALALGLAIVGGVSHALLAARPLGLSMLVSAVYISFLAAGGYSLVKKAGVEDLMRKALSKIGLALVLVAALANSGCAWLQAHPQIGGAAQCALDAIIQAAPTLVADVSSALGGGSPDWGYLLTLEEAHGPDNVGCVVSSLLKKGAVSPQVAKNVAAYQAEGGAWRHFGHLMRIMKEMPDAPEGEGAAGSGALGSSGTSL